MGVRNPVTRPSFVGSTGLGWLLAILVLIVGVLVLFGAIAATTKLIVGLIVGLALALLL